VGVATTLRIDAGHPALAGHFPGAPILPGVVLLDETVRAVEQSDAAPGARWRIGNAKFVKPVHPGEILTLEYSALPNGSIRFSVSSDGHAVAHGVLRPDAAPAARAASARASAPRTGAARWAAPERGSALLMRIMIGLSLALGRRVGRVLLYLVVSYFFLCAPGARRHAREYLRRALRRAPSARDRFRQLFAFASILLDRLYLVRGRYGLFALSTEGDALMRGILARGSGAFLLGAHLGSFEIMRAIGQRESGLNVVMAMYEDNASRVRALSGAGDSAGAPQIIPLGRMETMLQIRDRLDEGSFVGMLADRTIGEGPALPVSFLGQPALFPAGPMRAAAALRRPVIFMTGLYRGGNRYHVVFREIADFSQIARGAREAAVSAAIERYVALLEEYCRSDPYNWSNFYDFWHGTGASGAGASGTAA
jgi:predicted LPLAT superfamily acyltransferase